MVAPELENKLKRKVNGFFATFFERGAENRFADLIEKGNQAFPSLMAALKEDDQGERVDALVAFGRLFESHGPSEEALRAVVDHGKSIREGGMGPEWQATLFAMGRSRDPTLIESFMPMLGQPDPMAVNLAMFVMGYARWRDAAPFIAFVANQNHRDTVHTAIWALGQIGEEESVELLLPMLRRGENVEWVTGALGDIGSPAALEDLISLLTHPRTDIRFLSVAAMSAIIDKHKDRKVRRDWVWMVPALRTATSDSFPPVALFAMLILAELGEKNNEADVRRVLALGDGGPEQSLLSGLMA